MVVIEECTSLLPLWLQNKILFDYACRACTNSCSKQQSESTIFILLYENDVYKNRDDCVIIPALFGV